MINAQIQGNKIQYVLTHGKQMVEICFWMEGGVN